MGTAALARSLGCPVRRVEIYHELVEVLDEVIAGLAERDEPLPLNVAVIPDPGFPL